MQAGRGAARPINSVIMKTLLKPAARRAKTAPRSRAKPVVKKAPAAKKVPLLFELLQSCPDGDLLAKVIEETRIKSDFRSLEL